MALAVAQHLVGVACTASELRVTFEPSLTGARAICKFLVWRTAAIGHGVAHIPIQAVALAALAHLIVGTLARFSRRVALEARPAHAYVLHVVLVRGADTVVGDGVAHKAHDAVTDARCRVVFLVRWTALVLLGVMEEAAATHADAVAQNLVGAAHAQRGLEVARETLLADALAIDGLFVRWTALAGHRVPVIVSNAGARTIHKLLALRALTVFGDGVAHKARATLARTIRVDFVGWTALLGELIAVIAGQAGAHATHNHLVVGTDAASGCCLLDEAWPALARPVHELLVGPAAVARLVAAHEARHTVALRALWRLVQRTHALLLLGVPAKGRLADARGVVLQILELAAVTLARLQVALEARHADAFFALEIFVVSAHWNESREKGLDGTAW